MKNTIWHKLKLRAEQNNKKISRQVFTTLWRFYVFVTDSKIYQTLNYYLKSTKTNRSASVLSGKGKFIESSMASLMPSKCWHIQQTCFNESKPRKQSCIELSFIPLEELLKSTDLLFWVRGNLFSFLSRDGRPATGSRRSKIFSVRLLQIIFSFCLAAGFEKFSQLKVKIYRLPIVFSMSISRIAVVLWQKFKNLQGTTDSQNKQTYCSFCSCLPCTTVYDGICFSKWNLKRAKFQFYSFQDIFVYRCHGNIDFHKM